MFRPTPDYNFLRIFGCLCFPYLCPSLFECMFRPTPDYNFLRIFGCLCFPFLCPYHAHKLDFHSSPCVFLGYSSSHLGYHCLDLAYHRIYVFRHVRFHENVFPFANSEQITHTPVPSTQPTHLPPLYPPQFFQPTTLPTDPNNTFVLPSVAPQQTPHLPTASTSASPPPNLAILSSTACFSNDHYTGTGSPSPDALAFRSDVVE